MVEIKRMTKEEFVDAVAAQMGVSKRQAESVCEDVFDTIKSAVMLKGGFSWPGFGSLKCVKCAARKGRNPKTGEEIEIPEHNNVKFKAAQSFKQYIQY